MLSTLWQMQDQETAELMAGFWQQMSGEADSPAAALREAQLSRMVALRKTYGAAHPWLWSGVLLTEQGHQTPLAHTPCLPCGA